MSENYIRPSPLDKFGELMVCSLRDKVIEQNEMLLEGRLRGKAVQQLQNRVNALSLDQKAVIRDVVLDLLDVALHDVLFAFQEAHDAALGVEVLVDGQNIAELSGMLQGEPLGPNGWLNKFSKYPKADDK